MSTIVFHAQFTASKVSKTGIGVTCQYDRIKRSDGTITTVTGLTPTAASKTYFYILGGADLQTYDYIATFVTADATVDQQEVPALWTRYSEAVATDANGDVTVAGLTPGNLDVAVSTRLAAAAYMAPDNSDIAALVASVGSGLRAELDAVKAKTDNLPASPAAVGSAMVLAPAGLDGVIVEPAAGGIAVINARQALALIVDAAPAGILSGAATTSVTVKNPAGTATRVVATVDADGNRTGVVLSPPT